MPEIPHPDPEQVVARWWPLHGPYSPAHTATAADTLAELVRYLNYATGQGAREALPYASCVYPVVGGLGAAAGGLDQTLRQLAGHAAGLREDPTLGHCHHRGDPDEHQAADTEAIELMAALGTARHAAAALAQALNAAHTHLGPLYHREEDPS